MAARTEPGVKMPGWVGVVLEGVPEDESPSVSVSLKHILRQVRRFTGPRQGVDDTTLVVVKVDG